MLELGSGMRERKMQMLTCGADCCACWSQVEEARKELAWESEKKAIGLAKLKAAFLDNVAVEHIELHSLRSPYQVLRMLQPAMHHHCCMFSCCSASSLGARLLRCHDAVMRVACQMCGHPGVISPDEGV